MNKDIPVNIRMYLAGLMAGDGTVSVRKTKNSAYVVVQIGQAYKPTLDKIADLLHMGKVYIDRKTEKNVNNFNKQPWKLQLINDDATEFLEMILLYLPEKYEQSKHAIKFNNWRNKNIDYKITRDQILYCEKAIQESKILKEQMITIEDVEKYDLFKKKHYNPDIESGVQNTLDWFDDDYIDKKENNINEAKKIISPDINLDIIDGMTDPCFGGFFDAEGTVQIVKIKGSSKNVIYYELGVSIENSNFPILDKYCRTFGGSLSDPKINKNKKITWEWRIKASDALNFLEHIHPFTLEKREQIELAMEFMNMRNNKTLTQEKSEYLYRKVRDLKHVEYLDNGKNRVVPYGSNHKEDNILDKMKSDETLIQIETDFHKAVMNGEDIEYDSSYFDNNYRDVDDGR